LPKPNKDLSAAAVARDFTGLFLGASLVVMRGSLEPETIEAIACKEGLALASDLLLQDFKLACDNAGVVASIREVSMGSYGHVVQETRARLSEFRFVKFVHEGLWILVRSCIYADLGRHVWFVSLLDDVYTFYEDQ
jgi:hypothetical protein